MVWTEPQACLVSVHRVGGLDKVRQGDSHIDWEIKKVCKISSLKRNTVESGDINSIKSKSKQNKYD